MAQNGFAEIERAVESDGVAVFGLLARQYAEEKNYPLLFETRVMQARHRLGLPLIQVEPAGSLPAEMQRALDQDFIAAAREVGGLYLADGDIARAWPYFRAASEPAPVAAAIEKVEAGEGIDRVIEIAYHEAVNPYKGFQLILAQYGICRAITAFSQYPVRQDREECIRLLVRTLHGELVEALRRSIAHAEGQAPESARVPELIAGRDWLFCEYSYYVDTSHLVSVLQMSLELTDRASMALAVELAAYGRCLSANFQSRGEPPFEDLYTDAGIYLRALLGEDEDAAVEHFRRKLSRDEPAPAQVLVELLYRLRRHGEAIQVSLEYLSACNPAQLACPSVFQLCQAAGDYEQLRKLSRERGDLLHFAAAAVQERGAAV